MSLPYPHPSSALQLIAWLVPLALVSRALSAYRGLPTLPNLLLPVHDLFPAGAPTLTVIVPARNEQADIGPCLRSLLNQDYPHLQIIAIDDRSTDDTGAILDSISAPNLRVLHITDLPAGWLGKTHAMAFAARQATSDFLLFTDADILFRPDALRRALASAGATQADHLVLLPTTITRHWREAAFLSFFATLGLLAGRPWRAANPRAREHIGIGAFNLIRTQAYTRIGGFESLRMAVVEDISLGRRVKDAGLRQRVAFGPDLVRVHWASGIRGLTGVMTKNLFSVFNFHVSLVAIASLGLILFCIAPFAALLYPPTLLPAAISVLAILGAYRIVAPCAGLSPWNGLLAPFAAALFVYALFRSMATTLRQGGIVWRGTFYSLAELRANTVRLW